MDMTLQKGGNFFMWIKPAAVLMLGSLLLVGCNNDKANEPAKDETPMERVEDDVREGVDDMTPDVHDEKVDQTVPGDNEVIDENTTTEKEIIDENTTTNDDIVEDNLNKDNKDNK